jgi:hypothetical protein
MPKVAGKLFRAARMVDDLETLASGNPQKIGRRLLNKMLGRAVLGRSGMWGSFRPPKGGKK